MVINGISESNKRKEINFVRLLSRSEGMAKEKRGVFDWRLEKFVKTLIENLDDLKKLTVNQPKHEVLIGYSRRVDFLKGLLKADKLPNPSLKSLAVSQLVPNKTENSGNSHFLSLLSSPSSSPSLPLPSSSSSCSKYLKKIPKVSIGQQIFAQTQSRCLEEMKNELFYRPSSSQKQSFMSSSGDQNVDEMIRYHHKIQEKIADDMMILAGNLKENATVAGKIIRQDKEVIQKSSIKTEENFLKLKIESKRLEVFLKNVCNCWIWLLLFLVVIIFIWMVIFMKLFPKKI